MSWDGLKENFQIALQEKYLANSKSLPLFSEKNSKNFSVYSKGQDFLKSVDELRNLFLPETQALFNDILSLSTEILQMPPGNYQNLQAKIAILKEKITKREDIRWGTGGGNFVANTLFATAGAIITACGAYTFYHSIALLVAGTAVVASGPLLWVGIGLSAVILGLFIAGMAAYDAHINYRYYNEAQTKEIEEFARLLNPGMDGVNENSIDTAPDGSSKVIYC